MKFQKSACIEPMYAELPFLERFQAAKDDGFDFVEFWSWTDKDLDAVRAAAEKAGVGVSGFNGDAELSLIDPARREDYLAFLRRSVEAAKKVGLSPSPSTPTAWRTAESSSTTTTNSATR